MMNYFFLTAIFIGFEFASYTYEEQESIIPDPSFPEQQLQVINLIKSTESEQTFDIVVRATGSGDRPATFPFDYITGAHGANGGGIFYMSQQFEFRSDQDRLLFPIVLHQDDLPEGTETFKLTSLQQEGGAQFNPSVTATCTIFIFDDNDSKCN